MDSDELLPCPFCGSTDLTESDVGDSWGQTIGSNIECNKCGMKTADYFIGIVKSKWNTRPIIEE